MTTPAYTHNALELYRVTLDLGVIGVMGHCLNDVLLTVAELYPDQCVRSAVIAPEWSD
jgi:hypothetical protein